jgi:hypothetical protein
MKYKFVHKNDYSFFILTGPIANNPKSSSDIDLTENVRQNLDHLNELLNQARRLQRK